MKKTILFAILVLCSSGYGQTLKNLSYNTSSGEVVANTGTNVLTFTNLFDVKGSVRIFDGTNKAFEFPNDAEAEFGYSINFVGPNAELQKANTRTNLGLGATWLTNTDTASFRTAIGLGSANNVAYTEITAGGTGINRTIIKGNTISVQSFFPTYSNTIITFAGSNLLTLNGSLSFASTAFAGATRTNLGLGWPALTNSNSATDLLGYNAANGQVVYSGTNPLTFTNFYRASGGLEVTGTGLEVSGLLMAGTNASIAWEEEAAKAVTRTNLGLPLPALTNNNVTNFRTAIGLGTTNNVTFNSLVISADELDLQGSGITSVAFGDEINFEENYFNSGNNIFTWGTNSITFPVPATFGTNVTISGTLTAASIATSTPVSWSLDAVQTAAGTNGVLDLPLTANVLRITNANTISAITNGRLGAFYYIVNQSGTNLVLSNSSTLTTRGGGTVTLAPNQSATLLSTSATNATLQGGPSQLDSPTFAGLTATGNVTMSGTANTAPNQTAASGSSVMTRDLVDQRETDRMIAAPRMVWLTTFTGWSTAVSGGNVSQNVHLRASSGTNQWDYAVARNFQTGELFVGEGDQLNFSKQGGYGIAYFSAGAIYRDGTTILYLGAANNYVPSTGSAVSNPATKGIGWRIKDESIVATMYNTNYVEVATNSAILSTNGLTRENLWLYIDWNGAGGVSWYVNGNEIASTTNGPTGLTSVNQGYFAIGSVADVPLTTANQPSICAIVLDREP